MPEASKCVKRFFQLVAACLKFPDRQRFACEHLPLFLALAHEMRGASAALCERLRVNERAGLVKPYAEAAQWIGVERDAMNHALARRIFGELEKVELIHLKSLCVVLNPCARRAACASSVFINRLQLAWQIWRLPGFAYSSP